MSLSSSSRPTRFCSEVFGRRSHPGGSSGSASSRSSGELVQNRMSSPYTLNGIWYGAVLSENSCIGVGATIVARGADSTRRACYFVPTMGTAVLALRMVLAVVFVTAGVGKMLDLDGSRRAMADFGLPERAARVVGLLLP